MFETYDAAVRFLYDNLPMFQRIGAAALKPDLSNTIRLCNALGNPQRRFKSIHIAGTNGKGSSSHMLASILQNAGYKTGLYTSPHLKSFTERIRINGADIPKRSVVDFVNRIRTVIDDVQPSFFESTVAMAFDYFANEAVDVAVIETGLGGRLDSTNVILPELSLITNIGWDHKDILGDTLQKIASEKAGIIKANVPVVISEHQTGIDEVFIAQARAIQAPIFFAEDNYAIKIDSGTPEVRFDILRNNAPYIADLRLPLQGFYQQRNLGGVLMSADILNNRGFKLSLNNVIDGLLATVTNTGLKGRWQTLGRNPLVVCDTGHNVDGIREVVRQIRTQKFGRLYFVLGVVRDKDITDVLRALPVDAYYIFCQATIPRALDAQTLSEQASEVGLHGEVIADVNMAIARARQMATNDDMIFIGGSTFVVAEIAVL